MGLLDKIFGRGRETTSALPAEQPRGDGRRFIRDVAPDADATKRLRQLFGQPAGRRDARWQQAMWDQLWVAALVEGRPAAFTGPDGFGYARLQLSGAAGAPAINLAGQVEGIVGAHRGFVLFADGDPNAPPLWVAPMGVLVSLMQFDSADGDPLDARESAQAPAPPSADRTLLVAAPSWLYLAPASAAALRAHLVAEWNLPDPAVAFVSSPALRPTRALMIGKRASDFAREGVGQDDMHHAVQMLTWFLPPGRALMLMPDDFDVGKLVPLASAG